MKARFLAAAVVLIVALMAIAPQVMAQDIRDDRGNPIELTGPIMAIENDGVTLTITISGFTVDVTGAEVTTSLIIGAVVEAEGVLLDDGTIVAREVKAPDVPDADSDDSDDDLEFVGTLDSLIAGTAVVSGISFDITSAEVMLGLVVGDLVKVHANFDTATQTWIARELALFTGGDDDSDDSDDDSSRDDADDDSDGDDDSLDTCTFAVEVGSANLRSGPGVGYDVIGFAFDDDEFVALEIDSTSSWVKVATAEGDAWIAVSTGELEDDCSALGVSAMPFMDDDDDGDDDSDDDRDDDRGDDDRDDDRDDDDRDDDSDDDRVDDRDDDSGDDDDDDRDDDGDDDRDDDD